MTVRIVPSVTQFGRPFWVRSDTKRTVPDRALEPSPNRACAAIENQAGYEEGLQSTL
jgi:hypothetical protein